MRHYVVLIFTALLMTFFTARFVSLYTSGSQFEKPSSNEISSIIIDIQHGVAPIDNLDFDELFKSSPQYTKLDPFNFFLSNRFQGKKINFSNPVDCKSRNIPWVMGLSSTSKFRLWEEYICGDIKTLPELFFSSPPIVHPSGESYIYLALQTGIKEFQSREFLTERLPYFHISELNDLSEREIKLPEKYDMISKLSKPEVEMILDHSDTFISDKYIFIKKNLGMPAKFFNFAFSKGISYDVYDLHDVNRFLINTPFEVKEFKKGASCLFEHDNICWNYNLVHFFKMSSKSSIFFFLFSVLTIVLVLWALLKKLKADKIEEEKKRLALKVLSHEFRTPVTSLILQSELINKKLESLPDDIKDNFYEITANVYRLQRLTEMSKNYLMSGSKDAISKIKVKIVSVNEFFEDQVSEYSDHIDFVPLENDCVVYLDPYWPSICVKNLVSNALAHGTPPVTVSIKKSFNKLLVEIEDRGIVEKKELKKLTTEFTKGNKSEGTGLGLNIVSKVMPLLGGELKLENEPHTKFTLCFNGAFKEQK